MSVNILTVEGLNVAYARNHIKAVRDVSFVLGQEKLGIVGESGSGKSTVGRALMRLLPASTTISAKRLEFKGTDLTRCNEKGMRGLRGRRMGLIMQDPKYSLNPVMRIGDQIAESYTVHYPVRAAEAKRRAVEMLEAVSIRDPERVARLYPHEVSGGMGQRVMIAMMLIADPEMLIADEPTSALDVTVRLDLLKLLDKIVVSRNLGLILISHDLNMVRNYCDRVLIMYAGRIVEELPASELENARHPYTQGLLASLPRLDAPISPLPVLSRDPSWSIG